MSKKREYVNIFLIFLHFLFLYDKIVYDHLNVSTPKSAEKKPKYVVIPEEKKKKEKHEDKKEEEN